MIAGEHGAEMAWDGTSRDHHDSINAGAPARIGTPFAFAGVVGFNDKRSVTKRDQRAWWEERHDAVLRHTNGSHSCDAVCSICRLVFQP
jgi:hypothetical protein